MTADIALGAYPPPASKYFVIDLADLGWPQDCSHRVKLFPRSLNDCGDVVGYADSSGHSTDCGVSPWIWSLCGRFELGEQTLTRLDLLASLDATGRACPCDIDCSGTVDAVDMSLLLGSWGNGGCLPRDAESLVAALCIGCSPNEMDRAITDNQASQCDVEIDVVLGLTGQPSIEALAEWIVGLNVEQRESLASTLNVLCGSGGGI